MREKAWKWIPGIRLALVSSSLHGICIAMCVRIVAAGNLSLSLSCLLFCFFFPLFFLDERRNGRSSNLGTHCSVSHGFFFFCRRVVSPLFRSKSTDQLGRPSDKNPRIASPFLSIRFPSKRISAPWRMEASSLLAPGREVVFCCNRIFQY